MCVSSKTSWKTQDKDKEGMKNFSVLHPQLGGSKKLGGGSNVDLYTRDSNKFLPGSFLELNCLSQLQDANRAVQICENSSSPGGASFYSRRVSFRQRAPN